MKKALLWENINNEKVLCKLCGHRCTVSDGEYGNCGVRKNVGGTLYSTNYARLIASNVDPIEKKPVFHFLPGHSSLSIAAPGCNFRCKFCQNHTISQMRKEDILKNGEETEAGNVVDAAKRGRYKSISYTYTEPTVNFEYVMECSVKAKEQGIRNVWVTNGFMTKDAVEEITPYMDAANVDLKAFKEETYREVMGGKLKNVLDSISLLKEKGIWLEITTLVVPGMNDSAQELESIAKFIARTDPGMPWHVSRYHADYLYVSRRDATSMESLTLATEVGYEAGLRYIYCGNVWGMKGEHTYCHSCRTLLIERYGFSIRSNKIVKGNCYNCRAEIPGIWD